MFLNVGPDSVVSKTTDFDRNLNLNSHLWKVHGSGNFLPFVGIVGQNQVNQKNRE